MNVVSLSQKCCPLLLNKARFQVAAFAIWQLRLLIYCMLHSTNSNKNILLKTGCWVRSMYAFWGPSAPFCSLLLLKPAKVSSFSVHPLFKWNSYFPLYNKYKYLSIQSTENSKNLSSPRNNIYLWVVLTSCVGLWSRLDGGSGPCRYTRVGPCNHTGIWDKRGEEPFMYI